MIYFRTPGQGWLACQRCVLARELLGNAVVASSSLDSSLVTISGKVLRQPADGCCIALWCALLVASVAGVSFP